MKPLLLYVLLAACLAIRLPEHARGGDAMELYSGEYTRQLKDTAYYYDQKTDHFASASKTFKQKYYFDDSHFSNNPDTGAVVLYISGEGPLDGVERGFIETLAVENNALMISLEHRFYGESVPGKDLSNDNIGLLTVEQAMADLAGFIDWYSEKLPGKFPWITVGGSYAGALQAFFRITYPSHTAGGLSSSGVVNPIYEFVQFDEQIAISAGAACAEAMRSVRREFEAAIAAGEGKKVKSLFGALAADLSDPDFFYMIADSEAMAVQYGHKDKLCPAIVGLEKDKLISAFADFTNSFWGPKFGSDCFYNTQCLRNGTSRWQPTARAWRWQKCSQLAYFQTAPTGFSIRSRIITLAYHLNQCSTVFRSALPAGWPTVDAIISKFGGDEPKGEKIYFTNFSDDPWQRAGLADNASLPHYLAKCDYCGHCQDLHQPLDADPANLKESRVLSSSSLAEWIAEWRQQA